ncbi:MAG: cysteine protease ATG4 [Planctomycetia bacterium]|nr:cysteine protease ATG4 [Planctomycetia bacterium]
MDLYDAWQGAKGILKPQVQGDCGVYSFWYATVLLRQIKPSDPREVIYPRSHPNPEERVRLFKLLGRPPLDRDWSGGAITKDKSIRHRVKNLVGSGQGEILTEQEMVLVVTSFGYNCTGNLIQIDPAEFVSSNLKSNTPVLFAYMKGKSGPIFSIPSGATGGTDYGSHWSLIIKEEGSNYIYLDPHDPNTPQKYPKSTVLKSNAFVDDYKYVRYWAKGRGSYVSPVGNTAPTSGDFYDIGQGGRTQKLANALVGVF